MTAASHQERKAARKQADDRRRAADKTKRESKQQ